MGLQLGLIWEDETLSVLLAGNLARFEARAVVVNAQVSSFPMVNLGFAWTQATEVPLILDKLISSLSLRPVSFVRALNLKSALSRLNKNENRNVKLKAIALRTGANPYDRFSLAQPFKPMPFTNYSPSPAIASQEGNPSKIVAIASNRSD